MDEVACQSHEPNVTAEQLSRYGGSSGDWRSTGMLDACLLGLSEAAAAAAAVEAAQVTVGRADAPVVQQALGGGSGRAATAWGSGRAATAWVPVGLQQPGVLVGLQPPGFQ